jgi:hypothetical protein
VRSKNAKRATGGYVFFIGIPYGYTNKIGAVACPDFISSN